MARTLARYVAFAFVLVLLDACGRSWFEERPAWRHDAEVACLKSGAVKQGAGIAELRPIQGPGMCGADFPLRVTMLGEGGPLGFADDPRPPGGIPRVQEYPPPPPGAAPVYPAPTYRAPSHGAAGAPRGPMPITPQVEEPPADRLEPYGQPYPVRPSSGAPPLTIPVQPSPPIETVPLGREPGLASHVSVAPAATLACPLVAALDNWMATGVQPAAQRWFGQPVVEIKQISAYSCRSMNSQRGAPISEHAFGNALDVAAFTLADGRKITVRDGWRGAPEQRAFLHDVHASACRLFATVLAPGSNAFHYDHIHVDLRRHESGGSICEPRPIPGDLIARRGQLVTGSVEPRPVERVRHRRTHHQTDERFLPLAVPGED